MPDNHVHDCTGPGMRCPCGFTDTVPRFVVSFEVWDNQTKQALVDDCFSTDTRALIVSALRHAADKLE